jgi:signal transduction histidine kinase
VGSLQIRLLLTYLLIIFVTLGLTAAGLFFVLGGYRDTVSYGNLEDISTLVNAEVQDAISEPTDETPAPVNQDLLLLSLQGFISQIGQEGWDTSVMVINREGVVIAGRYKDAIVEDAELPTEPGAPAESNRCRIDVPQGPELLCVSTPLDASIPGAFEGTEAAAIVVAKPAADLGEVLGDLLPRLLFAGLVGLVSAIAMGFLLSKSVAAPLRRIVRAARGVARGNYTQRVPITGPREVREVASNFNRMTEEVQRSQQTLRDFLMNISHEIKTPLTSIRGFSQAVLDGTIEDAEGVGRSARIINDESTRVLRLVEELMDLSRLESGQISMRQEDVDVAELFGHIEEVFALRSEDSGVKLAIEQPFALRIRGDFDRLEQVLNNLLDNAFRHTPAGGAVDVRARTVQQGFVQVSVSDTGKGIPPEDVPHLFERFYRAANGRNTKGYGLGLAITREIVRAHGGDIWATSEPGRGTTFSFTLPAAAAAERHAKAPQPQATVARANS